MVSVASRIRNAVDEMSDEDIGAQVAQLKQDIASLTAALGKMGSSKVNGARRGAMDNLDDARSRAEEAIAEIRQHTRALERQVRTTVKENPLTTVAVAAGVILVLAAIARR
ncbi:MAG: DUF883 family protein [Phyllobacterium sp.]